MLGEHRVQSETHRRALVEDFGKYSGYEISSSSKLKPSRNSLSEPTALDKMEISFWMLHHCNGRWESERIVDVVDAPMYCLFVRPCFCLGVICTIRLVLRRDLSPTLSLNLFSTVTSFQSLQSLPPHEKVGLQLKKRWIKKNSHASWHWAAMSGGGYLIPHFYHSPHFPSFKSCGCQCSF